MVGPAMKKNSQIDIFGQTVKIVYQDLSKEELHGKFEPLTNTIYLEKSLTGKELTQVFIHECLHALFSRMGYQQGGIYGSLEEIMVDQIATWLSDNFKISKLR